MSESVKPYVQLQITPVNILLAGGLAYVLYKSLKGWMVIGDGIESVTESVADAYVGWTNPIVKAQIQLRSKYFDDSGMYLIPAAVDVFKQHSILFAAVFFPDGMIKPEYLHIIDDGKFYNDDNLPQPYK